MDYSIKSQEEFVKKHRETYMNMLSDELAFTTLSIEAVELKPDDPFLWASGAKMPIYDDNRLFMSKYEYRQQVMKIFGAMITNLGLKPDIIAGTVTAGISPATTLADALKLPLIYIRDKPKDHGKHNQIEGIKDDKDLEGKTVLLIEDLISSGGSSVKAVQAIRNANGNIDTCFSIFNYGFVRAADMFAGKEPFDKENGTKLATPCNIYSALQYDRLLQVAKDIGYLNDTQVKMLEDWKADPWHWAENHGFPKVEKK